MQMGVDDPELFQLAEEVKRIRVGSEKDSSVTAVRKTSLTTHKPKQATENGHSDTVEVSNVIEDSPDKNHENGRTVKVTHQMKTTRSQE
jgi:hypothetical protein